MFLTKEEQEMCEGKYGPGTERAMKMLVKYGEAFDAEKMVPVKSGHVLSDPYDWVSQMTEEVDRMRIFTTTHSLYPRAQWWRKMGIDEENSRAYTQDYDELFKEYDRLECVPAATCVPYLIGNLVKMGDHFSWPGSSGIVTVNSLLGGRGNRDASPTTWLSAITGRTPNMLLHKKENRYGQILVELDNLDLENFTFADYGTLGYYIGGIAGVKNVVIDGVPDSTSFEHMKFLLSPLPVSGAVALCHVVGVTPEAPTLEEALLGRKPEERVTVGQKEFREAYDSLNTAKSDEVDLVVFGCPHCSIMEIKEIASLLRDKKISGNVRLWVSTAHQIYALAERAGYVDAIEKAGGTVITGGCVGPGLEGPLREGVNVVATNSARAAHYIVRGGGNPIAAKYGSTKDCIDSALTGKWRAR